MSGFYIKIKGIQCEHCVATITQAIHSQFPTAQVSITRNIAHLTAPNTIDKSTLVKAICDSGYVTKTA